MTDSNEKQKVSQAKEFYAKLLSLQCTRSTSTNFLPISAFRDHTEELFSFFPDNFKIPPDTLQDDEWLEFFKAINLKKELSAE